MRFTQCAAFVAVADEGSFTKAAKALGVSQSAVSHAIAGLESDLRCELVLRGRAGVRLTDAGRDVVVHARAIVTHAEQIRLTASAVVTGLRGTVRFATSQTFAGRLLPVLLEEFRTRFPSGEIVLREGTDQQIAAWLRSGAVDVGVVTLPKPDLVTTPLWRDELCAVLPAGHRLCGQTAVRAGQLAGEPLVLPVGGVEPLLRAVLLAEGAEPAVAYRIRDLHALLAMVSAGVGPTVLPMSLLPGGMSGVAVVPLTPALTRTVALGVRETARSTPAVSAFVRLVRELARRAVDEPLSA
ncbi:LysR family transcriptional regulator [Lentzea sp. NPDC042327]|uniref:LysR family transcriptional regulator n=1 Tax=Lentzea sp. NPDC042327 TaxID=3154801 RepID=UPI0033CEE0FD